MRAWIGAALMFVCACGDIGPNAPSSAPSDAASSSSPPADPGAASGPSPIVTAIRTASDARYHIESRGFSQVANMAQDATGRWTATATLNGAAVNVAIAPDGAVTVIAPNAK